MANERSRATNRPQKGRWSATRKAEVVLRLLRGADLDTVSREVGVKTATLAKWRDEFLAAGEASLKARPGDQREDESRRLQAKVGELTMENELLHNKIRIMEGNRLGPRTRRSRP